MLSNNNILIGITAGIAAYKVCELIRLFRKNNANVKVVLTPNALNFVSKLTLQTLANNDVYVEQYENEDYSPEHIALCDWADIFVVAPATANTIGKIANGICDNLLTSILCAFKKTVLLSPAMNSGMWENEFVQNNIRKIQSKNFEIAFPKSGYLACGANGVGRMCEPVEIFNKTVEILKFENKILKNKKILITSGGTRENIDAVRYISNYSSGKMGYALAVAAKNFGADVTLVTTVKQTDIDGVNVINVNSALDMQKMVNEKFVNADCLIMAAAVADFRVKEIATQKIKKNNLSETLNIELVKNPDILAEVSKNKRTEQVVIGFCAETENVVDNAKNKINNKGCDFIVANDVSRHDIAFNSDENEVYVIDKNLNVEKFEKNTKYEIAKKVLGYIFNEQI